MPDSPNKDLTPLGAIISSSLDNGFLGLAKEMFRVFEVWDRAVGEFNAARTRPESIKDGRLRVFVESPVWIDYLGYLKADFVRNINEAIGAPLVSEIIFIVGPAFSNRPGLNAGKNNPEIKSPEPPVNDPAIQSAVAKIADQGLKESLAALLAKQKTGRK